MKLLLSFFLLFISALTYSQVYESGYLIDYNNDTVYALIQIQTDFESSNGFYYRELDDSLQVKRASSNAFKSVIFIEKFKQFESLLIDDNRQFCKVLVKGKLSLFKAVDDSYNLFYLVKDSIKIYKLEIVIEEFENKVRTKRKYVGMLSYLLRDCNEISVEEIIKTKYDDIELTRLLKKYNLCVAPEENIYIYDSKRNVVASNILELNTFISNIPTLNINYYREIFNPDISNSLSLNMGMEYYLMNSITEKLDSTNEKSREIIHSISTPVFVKYSFHRKKLSPYIYGGLTLNSLFIDNDFIFFPFLIGGLGLDYSITNNFKLNTELKVNVGGVFRLGLKYGF